VYSNNVYPATATLDHFYSLQEENGAIRSAYDINTGKPVFSDDNPEGIAQPLLPWVEFNIYHKVGQKKRLKDVLEPLIKHYEWLENNFKDDSGLYHVPLKATGLEMPCRNDAYYPVDFNAQMAASALYMHAIGDVLNDKDLAFRFKKAFFSLKTRINSQMWDSETGFYYDLKKDGSQLPDQTIAGFWTLLAELPNEERAEQLIAHLRDPNKFGSPNPFPSIAMDHPHFGEDGMGYLGAVFPQLTFGVIKGLEKYDQYSFAREMAIQHLYYVLDTLHPEGKTKGSLWEAYLAEKEGPAIGGGPEGFPRQNYITYAGLSTITLMIENIVGLLISLPRKTVDWIVPTLELMGIENLSLKRNDITILSNKSNRGWEIRLESEKLYYFTINILGQKKKTLPIPSGKCSMLIEKL
jgi:neutral trehalase